MTGSEARQRSGKKWSNDSEVIFDEGPEGTSFIWGRYGTQTSPSLGMRWNLIEGVGELGFPNSYGHPSWVVVPDCIARAAIVALLAHVCHLADGEREKWEPLIRKALLECDGGK